MNAGKDKVKKDLNSQNGREIGVFALGNLLHKKKAYDNIPLLELLRQNLPQDIEILNDGSTGLQLMEFLERKRKLIVLDAARGSELPGKAVVWRNQADSCYNDKVISAHQMGLAEVLYWSLYAGGSPDEIIVLDMNDDSLDEQILSCLQNWGAGPQKVPTQDIFLPGRGE